MDDYDFINITKTSDSIQRRTLDLTLTESGILLCEDVKSMGWTGESREVVRLYKEDVQELLKILAKLLEQDRIK